MDRPAKQSFGHAALLILSGLSFVSASAHGQPAYRSMFERAERIYAEECGPVPTGRCRSASEELHRQRVEAYKSARYELAEHIKHSGHSLDEPGMQGLAWELGYDSEKAEERSRAYSYYYACAGVLHTTDPSQIPHLVIDGATVSARDACIQGEGRTLPGSPPPPPPPEPIASNFSEADFPPPEVIYYYGDPKKRGTAIKVCKACAEIDPWHLGDLQAPEYKQADDQAKKERKKEARSSVPPPMIPKMPEPTAAGTLGGPARAEVREPTEKEQPAEATQKAPEATSPEKLPGSGVEENHAGGPPEEKPQTGQTPEKPSEPASAQKDEKPKDKTAQKHEGDEGAGESGDASGTESGEKKKHHKDPKPPKEHTTHHTKSPE